METRNAPQPLLSRHWTWVLLAVFGLLLGVILWGVSRGLDLGDEAFSYFTFQDPKHYLIVSSGLGYIVHAVLDWLNPTILTYRLARVALTLSGTLLFFAGFSRWYKSNYENVWSPTALLLFLGIGNLVTHFIYPQSIHYNSVSNFLLLGATGSLLGYLADQTNSKKWLLIAGACIGCELLVKITSGVLWTIVAMTLLPFVDQRRFLPALGMFLGGALIVLALYFGLLQSPESYQQQMLPFLSLAAKNSHALSWMLPIYAKSILAMFNVFWKFGGWLPVLWILAMRRWSTPILKWTFPVILIGVAFFYDYHAPSIMFAKIFWLLLILMMLSVREWKQIPILALLFILPLLGAFGTNIGITNNLYSAISFWFALSACLITSIDHRLARVFIGLMLFFAVAHAWFGYVKAPDNLHSDLLSQSESVPQLSALKGITLDPDTKQALTQIHDKLTQAGFHTGDSILSFYNLPGLVYALGGVPYAGGYYLLALAPYEQENCYLLRQNNPSLPAFILKHDQLEPTFEKCLKAQGIDLHDYQPLGSVSLYQERPTLVEVFKRATPAKR